MKRCHLFQGPSFWVSMLVFRGGSDLKTALFFSRITSNHIVIQYLGLTQQDLFKTLHCCLVERKSMIMTKEKVYQNTSTSQPICTKYFAK